MTLEMIARIDTVGVSMDDPVITVSCGEGKGSVAETIFKVRDFVEETSCLDRYDILSVVVNRSLVDNNRLRFRVYWHGSVEFFLDRIRLRGASLGGLGKVH
jgi:hypothetical protein